ncbi:uncharacterized protein KY384_001605 [Bacidia gigantensis]|uniref:uncharacterized protein n=1 Tax=Bacidia gigantensis TaxID=2732470 RepID=UPI001D03CBCB|nr:uncharacterized protein KY384_001605 [Bacidia gigantensis]KAG8533864.1 hypothetical protein KY384_001605 [Bacidia gigantensis]
MRDALLLQQSQLNPAETTYIYKVIPSVQERALAAICSDDSLYFVNSETFDEEKSISQVHAGVTCLSPVPGESSQICTAGRDGFVRLWDCRTPKLKVAELKDSNTISLPNAHGEEIVRTLCFAPSQDGETQKIYTGGEDGMIKAWRAPSLPSLSDAEENDIEMTMAEGKGEGDGQEERQRQGKGSNKSSREGEKTKRKGRFEPY